MAKNPKYRVLKGINYPPNKRAEVGDVVTDLPDFAINKLVAAGAIVLVDSKNDGKETEPVVVEVTKVTEEEATVEEVEK